MASSCVCVCVCVCVTPVWIWLEQWEAVFPRGLSTWLAWLPYRLVVLGSQTPEEAF